MKINLNKILWLQIAIVFSIRFIISISKINYLSYICDLIIIIIIYLLCRHYRKGKMPLIIGYILIEVLYWILNFIFEERSNYYLFFFMVREFIRFYIIFLAVQVSFSKEDFKKLFKICDVILYIHFFLVLFQIFVLKIANGDSVGGIFGIQFGYGNISSHSLLLISSLITMYNYLENKESVCISLLKFLIIFSIGMMTEMKSIIFEVVCIILLFLIFYKKIKIKTLILVFMMIVFGFFSINYLKEYFNFNILNIVDIETYLSNGYADNVEGIGRTDGFMKVYELGFDNNLLRLLFGYGLGSATSSYTFNLYGAINLEYFTYAKLFYDIGVIGCLMYFGFFFIIIFEALKMKKNDELLSVFSIITSIVCIYLNFYGSSMESDFTGYIMYILLAIPFVLKKEKTKSKEIKEKYE